MLSNILDSIFSIIIFSLVTTKFNSLSHLLIFNFIDVHLGHFIIFTTSHRVDSGFIS